MIFRHIIDATYSVSGIQGCVECIHKGGAWSRMKGGVELQLTFVEASICRGMLVGRAGNVPILAWWERLSKLFKTSN